MDDDPIDIEDETFNDMLEGVLGSVTRLFSDTRHNQDSTFFHFASTQGKQKSFGTAEVPIVEEEIDHMGYALQLVGATAYKNQGNILAIFMVRPRQFIEGIEDVRLVEVIGKTYNGRTNGGMMLVRRDKGGRFSIEDARKVFLYGDDSGFSPNSEWIDLIYQGVETAASGVELSDPNGSSSRVMVVNNSESYLGEIVSSMLSIIKNNHKDLLESVN